MKEHNIATKYDSQIPEKAPINYQNKNARDGIQSSQASHLI
jgi:hypothetical protein